MYNYGQTGFSKPSDFAVINGGGIRTSINTGPVTKGDVLAVLPFGNTIAQIDVTGKQIYEMFEHSLRAEVQKDENEIIILDDKGLPLLGRNGGYLQVSDSIKIIYDSNLTGALPEENIEGKRILRIQLRDRVSGEFKDVDLTETYRVATNDFLAAGGDGYTMLGGAHEAGPSLDVVFTEFLQGLTMPAGAKVVPFVKGKYALTDYENKFPYSRIIPMTQADFEKWIGGEDDLATKLMAELKAEVAKAEKLVEADYTKESWAIFAKALTKAQGDIAANVKDEKVLQKTLDSLVDAQKGLKDIGETTKPDSLKTLREKLSAQIAEAEKLIQTNYTDASWATLLTALTEAKALIAKDEKDLQVLETALSNLIKAQEALVKIPTKGKPSGSGNKTLPKTGSEELIAWIPGTTLILLAYAGYLRKKESVL